MALITARQCGFKQAAAPAVRRNRVVKVAAVQQKANNLGSAVAATAAALLLVSQNFRAVIFTFCLLCALLNLLVGAVISSGGCRQLIHLGTSEGGSIRVYIACLMLSLVAQIVQSPAVIGVELVLCFAGAETPQTVRCP